MCSITYVDVLLFFFIVAVLFYSVLIFVVCPTNTTTTVVHRTQYTRRFKVNMNCCRSLFFCRIAHTFFSSLPFGWWCRQLFARRWISFVFRVR